MSGCRGEGLGLRSGVALSHAANVTPASSRAPAQRARAYRLGFRV